MLSGLRLKCFIKKIIDLEAVTANNSCGSSAAKLINIWGTPSQPIITGPATVTAHEIVGYSVTNAEPGVTYTWTAPQFVTFTSGNTGTSVTVEWGAHSGDIKVTGTNSCGSSGRTDYHVTVSASPMALAVTPNPAQGAAKVLFTSDKETKYI